MLKEHPFYQLYEIPANTFGDVAEPTQVINDPAVLFVHADADEEFVRSMTAALFDNLDALGEIHPLAKLILHETAPNTPIELHPGAATYFDAH